MRYRRRISRRVLVIAAAAIVPLLAACGSGGDGQVTAAATDGSSAGAGATGDGSGDGTTARSGATADEEAMAELPAWQTLTLTDVDGVTFTLADLKGKPVFVENFATWCPNCRAQLAETNAAAKQVGAQAAFVALSVETDLSPADVAGYAEENGFDSIRFAVMTPEVLAAMADGLGQTSINPPSTPKVVIDAMGEAGQLVTGSESADEIVAKVTSGVG